jgi:hypothetical protein
VKKYMPNEAGDMKLLGNFRRLIDLQKTDPTFDSSNPLLKISKLEQQLTEGIAAVEAITDNMAPNKVAITTRQAEYVQAVATVRGSRNLLKSSGASADILEDADSFTRKVFGLKKARKEPDVAAVTSATEAVKTHSASQQSYDAILGNIRNYTGIIKTIGLYNPNEEHYKISGLETMIDNLEAQNSLVSTTFASLDAARRLRDNLLYTNEDCICKVAQMVKNYVKAIHGATSPQYKAISGLTFKR